MSTELIKQLGLPVALVVALLWFCTRKVWPWITGQIDELNKERRSDTAGWQSQQLAFLNVLQTLNLTGQRTADQLELLNRKLENNKTEQQLELMNRKLEELARARP